MTYSSLMVIRNSDSSQIVDEMENQFGFIVKVFGAKRMRALELIKTIL
jgi:hypothetical protein